MDKKELEQLLVSIDREAQIVYNSIIFTRKAVGPLSPDNISDFSISNFSEITAAYKLNQRCLKLPLFLKVDINKLQICQSS
jgi:hypothetical protein